MEFEFNVEGINRIQAEIRAQADLGEEAKDAINSALHAGAKTMALKVPRLSGDLAETIHVIDATYLPGGFGGGGIHQGELVVGDETTDYLNSLVEGTGIYGPLGGRIQARVGNIAPRANIGDKPSGFLHKRSNASVMQWYRGGKEFFRKSIAGQKPQDEWIDASRRKVNSVLARKIREIDISSTRRS